MRNLFITLFISALFSCGSTAQDKQSGYLLLNPTEFKEELSQTKNPQLIDVRTASEFAGGSIEGALNYDLLDASFENHIPNLDKEKTVFLFCAKGGRSGQAAEILKEKGFTSIIDLKGGYTAWVKSK